MNRWMILIATAFFWACSSNPKGFEIKVELEGAEGELLLERRGPTQWIPVDTAEIVNGTALLEGEVTAPEDHYLSVPGRQQKILLFVENGKMTVSGSVNDLDNLTVTGSKSHNEFNKMKEKIIYISELQGSLHEEARKASQKNDTTRARLLSQRAGRMLDSSLVIQRTFVQENPGSFVTPYFLMRLHFHFGMPMGELDTLVTALKPKLDASPAVVMLKDRLEQLKSVSVGRTAHDFTMNDPEGNPITFSDVYKQNEYTLLDFWAGWCTPCRRENPNIVAVYNDYKDKGFGVFGVSLDRHRESWVGAINSDSLTWPQVSDLQYWNNTVAKLYSISSIPASFLVDRSGKIVARDLREEELRQTIAQLLD